jgi:hypothetical protein
MWCWGFEAGTYSCEQSQSQPVVRVPLRQKILGLYALHKYDGRSFGMNDKNAKPWHFRAPL